MRLKPYHEIIGILSNIKKEGGHVKTIFSMQWEVEIPSEAISQENLWMYIGERIGIFNCDGVYKIRKIRRK